MIMGRVLWSLAWDRHTSRPPHHLYILTAPLPALSLKVGFGNHTCESPKNGSSMAVIPGNTEGTLGGGEISLRIHRATISYITYQQMESKRLSVAVVVVVVVFIVVWVVRGRSTSSTLLRHIFFPVSRRSLCFMCWALANSSQGLEKVWTTVLAFSEVGRLRGRNASHFKWPFSCKCLVACGSALDLNGFFERLKPLQVPLGFRYLRTTSNPGRSRSKLYLG